MSAKFDENVTNELADQKKLLILLLLALGYKQKQIASTLGISEAKLSKMLPTGISRSAPDISGLAKAMTGE